MAASASNSSLTAFILLPPYELRTKVAITNAIPPKNTFPKLSKKKSRTTVVVVVVDVTGAVAAELDDDDDWALVVVVVASVLLNIR